MLAVLRYRSGVTESFEQGGAGGPGGYGGDYGPDGMGGTSQSAPPYAAYPTGGDTSDPYQQAPPFSGQPEQKQGPPQGGDFQPPTY